MVVIKDFASNGRGAYDITPLVRDYVKDEKLDKGLLIVSVLDSLCALTMTEYEPNLISDIGKLLENLPTDNDYVKLSLFSKTLIIPISERDLFLGSFQQIVLIDLNKEKGNRKIAIDKVYV